MILVRLRPAVLNAAQANDFGQGSAQMTRRLLTSLSALSLLLFMGLAALCIRSQFRSDIVERVNSSESDGRVAAETEASIAARTPWWADCGIWYDQRRASSDRGGIVFDHSRLASNALGGFIPSSGWYYSAPEAEAAQIHLWPTYEATGTFVPPDSKGYGFNGSATLKLPYWLLLSAAAILPSITLTRAFRNRARPHGVCRKCGYDLRASKERCPECGMLVTAKEDRSA